MKTTMKCCAVAWFTYKHGKIDWIESNNEYWLRQDAALRRDFHVETGFPAKRLTTVRASIA
ncbi:MAG: hypothetical protein ACLRL6_09515 [Clostridium sp.]